MNLLLLLSALLSALTGVGGQARAPQVAAAVRVAAEQTVVKAANVAGERPGAALPSLLASSAMPQLAAFLIETREPLFSDRRRE